jgi:hypothetical protein
MLLEKAPDEIREGSEQNQPNRHSNDHKKKKEHRFHGADSLMDCPRRQRNVSYIALPEY